MKIEDIEKLVRPNIRTLSPYSTARDEYGGIPGVFMDANESPYPTGWNRYPDPRQKVLKARFADLKAVSPDRIFLGNGSDEAIDVVLRVFCEPGRDNVIAISPSYGMYGVAAAINDIEVREVLLEEDFSLPADRLLAAADEHSKVIFLCSPNNPTGNAFEEEKILEVVNGFSGIVVLDEAYCDFSSCRSLVSATAEHPNLIVLQTCSKARGLAALRLGLAFAEPYVISLMSMVKYPYNINESTQRLAMEALSSDISAEVAEVKSQRARLADAFSTYPFIREVWPSEANFILVRVDDADALYDHLIRAGIIVRNRNRMPLCSGCLRITVGLPSENDELLKALDDYETCDIC